ncbi:MAG: AraC family transcriptional regulator [Curvibacter sp.]|nr:MAG: AraC family transcriptional regulator [Curvibacter sp.]
MIPCWRGLPNCCWPRWTPTPRSTASSASTWPRPSPCTWCGITPQRGGSRAQAGLSRRQMQQVEEALRSDLAGHWTVERMAQLVDLSPFHFSRAFRASFGAAPHAWLKLQRLEAAAQAVRASRLSLEEIARQTGHRSASHFTQSFRQHWGMTPSAYRRAS